MRRGANVDVQQAGAEATGADGGAEDAEVVVAMARSPEEVNGAI